MGCRVLTTSIAPVYPRWQDDDTEYRGSTAVDSLDWNTVDWLAGVITVPTVFTADRREWDTVTFLGRRASSRLVKKHISRLVYQYTFFEAQVVD